MKYNLDINRHNIQPHLDIERDIQNAKDGLFTFNLRISQGNIEDYARFRTVTEKNYRGFILEIRGESKVSRNIGERGSEHAIRPDKR